MVWSTTTSTRPNSATKHRGGPLNDLYRLLTNINLELIDPDLVPKISTLFKFHGRKVAILDSPAGDHGSYFDNSGINLDQDQFMRIPEILNTEESERIDTLLFQRQEIELTKKTLDFDEGSADRNIATNMPGTAFADDSISPDKLQQITDKAKLHSDVLYTNDSQIVTNKTWDIKDNTFLRLAKTGYYSPGSASLDGVDNAHGMLKGMVGLGVKTQNTNTGGKYDKWSTVGGVNNDVAGLIKLDNYTAWRTLNPLIRFAFLFDPNTSNNRRVFKGWGAQRLLTLTSDTAPLESGEYGFLFGHGAADSVFSIFHNDASGACVKVSTGINLPAVITNYILEIQAVEAPPSFTWTLYSVSTIGIRDAILGTGTFTTNIPSNITGLYPQDLVVGSTTAIQSNNIHLIEVFNS